MQNADLIAYHKDKLLIILTGFEFMWDGHSGKITVAKHQIELT